MFDEREHNKMNKKRILRNQKGFTLIEIIAVLIILGVLAAVAVPKFIDLTNEAKQKALDGAIAAGMSQVSMDYARLLLSLSRVPTNAELAAGVTTDLGGDFDYTFEADTNGIKVTVASDDDATNTRSSIWKAP